MSNPALSKVLILSGPTGVGKTAVAALLSAILDGEIISCDSVQVYKELVIGANKDNRIQVPQHLIDIVSWRESNFTNADFNALCHRKLEEISKLGKVPLLVGGTGFYTKWIMEGKPGCPPPSQETMQNVEKMIDGLSWEDAIKLLEEVDPEYAASLFKNDKYRLKRALSNWIQTQQPMSAFKRHPSNDKKYDFRCYYLSKDRQALSLEIDSRCEQMIFNGLLKEVGLLWRDGLKKDCPAGRAIGYADTLDLIQELWVAYKEQKKEFFHQDWVVERFQKYLYEFKAASRQYSRRQDSWHKNSEFKWIDYEEITKVHPSNKEGPLKGIADYIISTFNLSRKEWEENGQLQQIHQDSLSARWADDMRANMRQYSKVLKKTHSSFDTKEKIIHAIKDQLNPVFTAKSNDVNCISNEN